VRERFISAATALALALAFALCGACAPKEETVPTEPVAEVPTPTPEEPREWSIALHGGAGVIDRERRDYEEYFTALEAALELGARELASGTAAVEVVEQVITMLEDDPKFNAGRGAVLTSLRTHELDAAIMDGRTLSCGAVAGIKNVRNPIQLARQVMERSPHVLLVGQGADDFAREIGLRRVQQSYFTTEQRVSEWLDLRRRQQQGGGDGAGELGTVGVVALDRFGNLAAGTSTGGLTNKRYGRVGDVPIIGAGTFADNRTVAVSCTGKGEEFIRHGIARALSDRIALTGESLEDAARFLVHETLQPGDGGLIAVDARGALVMEFNTPGMFRGAADSSGRFEVGIWDSVRTAPSPAATESDGPASSAD
jgi:beta-aspartyl-peptidase (threonine type)